MTPLALIWLSALSANALAQPSPSSSFQLDPAFEEQAMAHIRYLAALDHRVAGTRGETRAARYVKHQMQKAGLTVTVEPFAFDSFQFDSAALIAGAYRASALRLAVNPYAGGTTRNGALVFVETFSPMGPVLKADLADKIVVTTENEHFAGRVRFLSMFKRPRAIVALSRPDFDRFQAAALRSGQIAYRGRVVKIRSANIIGTLGSGAPTGQEIVLSAHYDSSRGPGANDNASGVAVLLELARYFHSLQPPPPLMLRFLSFGAEELGLMGSKAYLQKHRTELQHCRLLFNMDTVGGNGGVAAEILAGGPSLPKPDQPLPLEPVDKAISDIDARWVLLYPSLSPLYADSTVPEWLRTAVSDTGTQFGLQIHPQSAMGSDHRVFAQAGIVATDISTDGPGLHTPADALPSITPRSLQLTAQIVAMVVEKTLRRTR